MKQVLERSAYPGSRPPSLDDGRFFVWIVTASLARRIAHAFTTPGPLLLSSFGFAALILLLMRGSRLQPAGGRHGWVLPVAAGLLVILGLRTWWQHLATKLEDSTWVALGGNPIALSAGVFVTHAALAAAAFIALTRRVDTADRFATAVGWWSVTIVAWVCLSLAVGALLRRANRRPRWWSAGGIAAGTACAAGAALLAVRLATPGANPQWMLAGASVLVIMTAAFLVPRFLAHERVRLGFDVRDARSPEDRAAASRPAPAGFVGVRKIGALLVGRTLMSEFVQVLGLAGFAGIVAAGFRTIEGPARALLVIAGFLVVVMGALAVRFQQRVGRQHLFLFLHRPARRNPLWRELALGECAVFAGVMGAVYLLLTLPTPALRREEAWPVLFFLTIEWAAYVALAAHALSPGTRGNDSFRPLLVPVAAVAAGLLVLLKAIIIGNVLGRWMVPVQAIASAVAAISWGARTPYYLTAPRRVSAMPERQEQS